MPKLIPARTPDLINKAIEKIANFDEQVLRNIIGLNLNLNAFDDLSDDPLDWKEAGLAADFSNRFGLSELQYNAIDYVFDIRAWPKSRFGNGDFPVWYGSLELETSFYETTYHWLQFLKNSPGLIKKKSQKPICNIRTVFSVQCQSSLVDLREKTKEVPSLISKNNYQDTQRIGSKLAKEGFPGLIALSARITPGSNLAVFNKQVLKSPQHQGDYLYQVQPNNLLEVEIFDYQNKKQVGRVK